MAAAGAPERRAGAPAAEAAERVRNGDSPEALLEQSWEGRGRPIRGRELRLELGVTAAFALAAAVLAASGGSPGEIHPVLALVILAYALAACVEFPIGAAFFVPTQLLLVPMFVVAPAQFVPVAVFAALVLAAVAAAAAGVAKLDRVVFTAGDSVHALGPALVVTVLAGGDAADVTPAVIAAAFAAQIAADFVSSSVHELLAMGAPPRVHVKVVLQAWSVDLALGSVGLLAALAAVGAPWAALAPVPLVLLLRVLAADRVRRIGAAHERLVALEVERGRRRAAGELLERHNRFLQDVSHELRTPVTIARGHLENHRRLRGPNPESGVAIDELDRIERIVERLLVLARAGEENALTRQRLDAEDFLEELFVRWSDTVPRPWQLGALARGELTADGDALRAALDALLENAVKHTTTSQHIRLSSRAEPGGLLIEVADGGSGIPEEALDRIFERFARADRDRDARVAGTGLGLATVDAVARAHGGACSVRSGGGGSTFALRLPSFEPAREPGRSEAPAVPAT